MIIFRQKGYYYYLNGFIYDCWFGSRAILYKDLINQYKSSIQNIRDSLAKTIMLNGGWHFSYLSSPEEISKKINSFAHSEYDKPDFTNVELIRKRITEGENIFNKKEKINYVMIDNSYPKYIVENIEKYAQYINQNY
jgi:beta-1,4-mannosyl-glycoprotein beta-1,4-N-acetylglucosaminyltransferase